MNNTKSWSNGSRSAAWVALTLLLFLCTANWPAPVQSTTLAQEPIPDPLPISLPLEPIPSMAFQPTPDADDLSDFLPPQALELHVTANTDELVTTATLPNAPLAIHFGQAPVSLMVEADTFAQPVQLSFKLLASANLTQTTALVQSDLAAGSALSETHSLTETAVLPHSLVPQTLLQFQIEILDAATGQPVEQFQKQVRLVIDLRQLGFPLDGDYHQFYLAYQDEDLARESLWSGVPIWVHQKDGLISAEVSHFSDWTAGWRPTTWGPNWAPPSVSDFSGAATYQHSIEVPPGRKGLQPSVSLSYNSRVLDGAIRGVPESNVASGWSLAEISIAREGVETFQEHGFLKLRHPDRFRLVLNGTGYELFPEPGVDTSTAATVRYHAKDAPHLFVKRVYGATGVPNTEGIYWIVKSGDGTTYRLGYYDDAEEWQRTEHIWQLVLSGHPGHNTTGAQVHSSAIRWYVDTVTDAFGNQIVYTYNHSTTSQYACGDLCGFQLLHWHHKVRLATISYNYPGRINISGVVPDNVARLSDTQTPGSRVAFHARGYVDIWGNWNENLMGPIQNIMIYHGANVNTVNPIKEYRLETRQVHFSPAVADCPDRSENYPDTTTTRVVDSIQLWVGTDRNHHVQEGVGNGVFNLPPIQMFYEVKPHYYKFGDSNRPCYAFSYLKELRNGYGGRTVFTYASDNRSVGEHRIYNYHAVEWPAIGFNFFVSEVKNYDGRNSNPVKTTYSYHKPCYGQTSSNVGGLTGAVACPTAGALEYGNITGFETTTQINYDYNQSSILNKRITTFSQNANNTIGRPTRIDVQDSNSVLLSRTDHQYVPLSLNGLANMFTYTSQTQTYQYQSGVTSNSISTKVTYEYNTANQGGTQYGNLTHIREFDSADAMTPYRTTVRWYYPRTSDGYWMVGYMGAEARYAGDVGTLLNGVWNYYDNDSNPSTPPTQGKLMRSRAYVPMSNCSAVPGGGGTGCVHARQTIDTTHAYDQYGNQTATTTYPGYGYRTFNSSWGQVYNAYPTGGRTTTIAYESGYNLYPISVSNPLGQVTTFQIYGFNGVAVDGFQVQPGLLKKVTPPDSVVSIYEYDPFGRLWAVYDSEASRGDIVNRGDGDPVVRVRYWDNSWNAADAVYLNPAGNAPFLISEQKRPGSFSAPANAGSGFAFSDQTFYDGFGRPIQTRSIWRWVEGQSRSREIISHTDYHANGQVSCQSVPYDIPYYSDQPKTSPASPFYTAGNCANKPRTTTTYDALGRPLVVTAPDGTNTAYSYFILNNVTVDGRSALALTNVRDANNRIVGQMTNSLGQLAMVQENEGAGTYTAYSRTRYYYDPLGNLKEVRTTDGTVNGDPNPTGPETLRRVVMGYDNFGRKISMNDPDMGNWSYVYDAAGNLKEQRDANLARLCFEYDTLDRLTHKRHDSNNNGCDGSDTQLAFYAYFSSGTGKVGKPSEIRWSSSSTQNRETFNYDSQGRLITHNRWVDSRQYTMSYGSFDTLHRPTAITYPNGEVIALTYDREGENSLRAGSDWLVTDIRYNARGQMTYLDRHNVADTTYLYHPQMDASGGGLGDSNFRLRRIQHGGAGTGDTWPDFTYEYDRVGNITRLTTASTAGTDAQSFGYDHLNRLLTAVATGGVANYTHNTASTDFEYDRLGNITYFGNTTLYNYANRHSSCGSQPLHAQPHAVKQIGANYYCYDNNGNMTRRVEGGVTYQQTFNVENELASVLVSGQTTSFTYDAAGIRVKTVKPNGVVIDHPFPTYEVENPTATTPIRRSIYTIAGQTIATRVSGDPVSGNNGLTYFYNDHLGSNSALRKPDGSRVATYYLPFGNYRGAAPNQTITDRDFTGQPQNRAVGLLYYQARFYVPSIGRFASADTIIPDPAQPQTFNRYTYVFNRPLVLNDPSGHCPWCIGAIGGAIAGAVVGYGAQVYQNMQNGQSFTAALTTDIDAGKIVAGAVVGAVVGGTLGAAAPALTTYGTVAAAQVQTTAVAAAAAHPTAAAAVGGLVETAVECSMTGGGCGIVDYAAGALTAGAAHRLSAPGASSSPGTALTQYDPEFASRSLLGQNYPGATGYGVTPGGRTVSAHAAERVALGGPGRPATNLTVVDNILDSGNQVRFDPVRNTIQVRATQLPGRPYVVVSGSDPNHIVTVMAPR